MRLSYYIATSQVVTDHISGEYLHGMFRLRNDLYCVGWGVKLLLTHSLHGMGLRPATSADCRDFPYRETTADRWRHSQGNLPALTNVFPSAASPAAHAKPRNDVTSLTFSSVQVKW